MRNPLSKIPFLFFLLSLIVGILFQYYFKNEYISIVFFLSGTMAMLLSYFVPKDRRFSLRWLFGLGVVLATVGIGAFSTAHRQYLSEYTFSGTKNLYRGIVTDSPQEKVKTVAYRVLLPDEDRQVVCYFQRNSLISDRLNPGDEFLFYGEIQPFRNMGNPNDFDYVRYMYNQNFVGSVYVSSDAYKRTGEVSSNFKYQALRCRQAILDFYKALDLKETEYAVLFALTLGYQNELSDDLKQGFRTTGTVHVLSVSGLHVGIIYVMMTFLLGFVHRNSKYYWIKPVLIILLLWGYAFITGLPPSVVRASAMLSVFCVSEIVRRKSFSIHALFIAAFFMLLVNPFSLFDIGLQLSFMSVLSILYLHPKMSGLIKIKNKYIRYIWQMFALSVVAQLATFPICLYYFGTFPTYFFIANLIIVPVVSLIMYAAGGIVFAKVLSFVFSDFSYYLYYLPVKLLQVLISFMTYAIHLFEQLPFALLQNVKVSFVDLLLIFTMIIGILAFLIYKKSKALIIGLTAILILLTSHIHSKAVDNTEVITVYNRSQASEIKWSKSGVQTDILPGDTTSGYIYIGYKVNNMLILSSDNWKEQATEERFKVNNLVLTHSNSFSLYSLTQLFWIENVVLDTSLSRYTRHRLAKECQKLNIPYHDVTQSGAFSLIF
ncbi:MAG TPA: ComEC/Rec2 family competence protein [Dysgonomonas sp.]|uniref:ComEC/Rec2 family competence protein n=1 Tax=unclassified Dysgonomonas TaxID=2630389 RepID=UPI0025BA92B1|nr:MULTISPECIES: ComEC/Rec2 family competence protein [unclassified Dysgonomonas]HML66546.1 ComEC/Rec2 family competence protein [Dysgonomonas sp.]